MKNHVNGFVSQEVRVMEVVPGTEKQVIAEIKRKQDEQATYGRDEQESSCGVNVHFVGNYKSGEVATENDIRQKVESLTK